MFWGQSTKIIRSFKMSKNLLKTEAIEKIFNIKIKDPLIWFAAVIHKSWIFYHKKHDLPNNERLEFLGDSVLQLVTSHYLYEKYPQLSEGDLSLLRANLVNRQRLGKLALKFNLDKIINIAPNLDERGKITVLGDSLEALIGALYLDQGLEIARNFILEFILKGEEDYGTQKNFKDPKTLLQEIFQAKYKKLPVYKIAEVSGPPHKRKFKVEIYLDEKKISEGQGNSKQEAEFDAALKILKKLQF